MLIEFITLATFLLIVSGVFFIRSLLRGWQGEIGDQIAVEAVGGSQSLVFGEMTDTLAAQIPPLLLTDDELTKDLHRAGYYKPAARSEFLAIRNVLAISAVVLTGVYAVMVGPERPQYTAPILIWGFTIAAIVYAAPWVYLRSQARQRLKRIQRALPDAFDMLSMCLTGGLGIHESLAQVSREIYFSHPDLAVELEIVRRHAEMTSLADGFRHFAERIDVPEVVAVSALIAQTERLGTNVVQAIRDYADGVRLKIRQTADERASKAGIKLLFPLVLCLAPATLIILWGPAVLELRDFFRTFSVNG